jgi:hypothetical protein
MTIGDCKAREIRDSFNIPHDEVTAHANPDLTLLSPASRFPDGLTPQRP